MLKPLGSRLLIRPDPPETVIGGILLPQSADTRPAMTGTVIAVGRGSASAQRVRQETLAQVIGVVQDLATRAEPVPALTDLLTALVQMARDTAQLSEVVEGECVCFAFTAGTNITVDDVPWIVIDEDDIDAVWTPDEEGVA